MLWSDLSLATQAARGNVSMFSVDGRSSAKCWLYGVRERYAKDDPVPEKEYVATPYCF